MDLTGRIALVTGAARGIGLATSELLAERGAAVARVDQDAAGLDMSSREGFHDIVADVTKPDAVAAAVGEVVSRHDRIDILVNNAGVAGRSLPTWELDLEDWSSVLAINLTGTFLFIRAALGPMRSQGYGRIVNVASIAGKEGNPNAVPYSASKAGVIGLTKAVAKEVADLDILVNCVTPAVITTPLLEQVSEAHLDYMLSKIPMRRAGDPVEVARLIAWLASDEASFTTGAVFDISGGRATY